MKNRKIIMMRKFQLDAMCKLRMIVVIIALLSSGLYIGFEAGKNIEYIQTENKRIALNKEVKHHEHFIRWKLGELRNWENQINRNYIKTARLKKGN